ncbi:MAG: hypothetical protein H6R48_445 [Proteobacteria bacterium]|nr:hypothetical protein [Pseudomonadota bacterium]
MVQVDAAVAHRDPVQGLLVHDRRRQGRAGVVAFAFPFGQGAHGGVGLAQQAAQGGGDGVVRGGLGKTVEQHLDRRLAGGAAQGVAAHAIGQHGQRAPPGQQGRIVQVGKPKTVLLFGAVAAMLGVAGENRDQVHDGDSGRLSRRSSRPA